MKQSRCVNSWWTPYRTTAMQEKPRVYIGHYDLDSNRRNLSLFDRYANDLPLLFKASV